jgi:hypothetical protein
MRLDEMQSFTATEFDAVKFATGALASMVKTTTQYGYKFHRHMPKTEFIWKKFL